MSDSSMQISIGDHPFSVASIEVCVPDIITPVALRPGTSDEPTFIQVFIQRQYDFEFGDWAPRLIVDGGANVGYSSVRFKNRFPEARIVAIEPEDSNCTQFRQNLREYSGVELIQGGLWSKSGSGRLVTHAGENKLEHWAYQVCDETVGSRWTQLFTVSDIIRSAGADSIDLLKLDIEGAEDELFCDGCEEWLRRVEVLILEFHELIRPGSAQRIVDRLSDGSWEVSERGEHYMFRRR